jgi:hypothetical protein
MIEDGFPHNVALWLGLAFTFGVSLFTAFAFGGAITHTKQRQLQLAPRGSACATAPRLAMQPKNSTS